jgi:hypothetical protein
MNIITDNSHARYTNAPRVKTVKKMKKIICLFGLMLMFSLIATTGCRNAGGELITFSGRVTRVPLEGGFYGIVSDEGERYDPLDLADEFRKDGLRVRVTARPKPDMVSFHMWGVMVEIESIRKAASDQTIAP